MWCSVSFMPPPTIPHNRAGPSTEGPFSFDATHRRDEPNVTTMETIGKPKDRGMDRSVAPDRAPDQDPCGGKNVPELPDPLSTVRSAPEEAARGGAAAAAAAAAAVDHQVGHDQSQRQYEADVCLCTLDPARAAAEAFQCAFVDRTLGRDEKPSASTARSTIGDDDEKETSQISEWRPRRRMIIHTHRVIFVHIQKTAGHSVTGGVGQKLDLPERNILWIGN